MFLISGEALFRAASQVTGLAVNWWIQSALLIAAGLAIGGLLRGRGSAVQSAVYRTTLAALLVAPLATWALGQCGLRGWSVEMPATWAFIEDQHEVVAPGPTPAFDTRVAGAPNVAALHSSDMNVESLDPAQNAIGQSPATTHSDSPRQNAWLEAPSIRATAIAAAPMPISEQSTARLAPRTFGYVALGASAAWIGIAAVMLTRLASAWHRLAQIRRVAASADVPVQRLCREVARTLDVSPPHVLHSPSVPSPCVTGLWRPAVLLPAGEVNQSLRDVLVHELAHISRGDCHWNLLRRVAGALLFFQPLMWRLARQLEVTAEEVCDDFVVHLSGDRRRYAVQLVDIAELAQASFAPAGVGIVSMRSMLGRRVSRIMDRSRSLSMRVGGALLALVLVGGVVGTFTAGLVGLRAAAATEKSEGDRAAAGQSSGHTPGEGTKPAVDDDVVKVHGLVVDPAGKPMPNVDVFALRWYWNYGDRQPLAAVKTNADGQFEISYRKSQFAETAGRSNQWREAFIAAFADGFGPGWVEYGDLKSGERATVHLAVDDVVIEGRVIDLEGKPIPGVTVEVGSIAQPKGGVLDDYLERIKAGQAISTAYAAIDESLPHHSANHWPKLVTDADGQFRIAGFGRERLVDLHLSGPTIVTTSVRVATRRMKPIVHPAYAYEEADNATQYGAQFEYAAAPSRLIRGVVKNAETGEPIAGAEIWSWKFAGQNISGITTVKTKSDAQGRYELSGMPKGDGNEIVVVPTNLPYFTAEFEVADPPGSEPVSMDLTLHRGVWVTGRVTDKESGKPVPAQMHYIAFPDNKLASKLPEFENGEQNMNVQDRYTTDAEGRYRVVALPGHGIIGLNVSLTPYPGGQGYKDIKGADNREAFMKLNGVFSPTEKFPTAVKEVHIDAGAAETTCDFELDPGGRMRMRAVDSSGAPVEGVRVTGMSEMGGQYEEAPAAEFELTCFRPGENRTVLLYHPERRLGKGLYVRQADGRDEALTVELEPCATVKGRLTNDGAPVKGANLRIDVDGDNDFGRQLTSTATDAEGRFQQDAVLPGLKYSILAEGARIKFSTVAKQLEVYPGETIDLGTIDIASKDRPQPMRSGGTSAAADNGHAANETPATSTAPASAGAMTYAGSVVTPDGKPAAGADIYLVFYVPQPAGLLEPVWKPLAKTDDHGAFRFSAKPSDFGLAAAANEFEYGSVVAVKEGFGFAWSQAGLYETSGASLTRIREKMKTAPAELIGRMMQTLAGAGKPLMLVADDQPIRGRVVDINGQGVAGVGVMLEEVWASKSGHLDGWRAAAKRPKADYYSARMETPLGINGPQVRSLVTPALTDENGQFTLRGVGRGRIAQLLVNNPGIETARVFVRTESGQDMVVDREHHSPDLGTYTYHAAEFTHVAGPSTPIEGVVRDADTKQPLAGITVKSQARHGERINGWGQDFVRAVTDDEGRYRLMGMPIGDDNRIAAIALDGEAPYVSMSKSAATTTSDKPLTVDFNMRRGVWIEGRLTDKASGKGLRGTLYYFVKKGSPNYGVARSLQVDERDRLKTDDSGRFRIVALSGPGFVAFSADDHQNYQRATSIVSADGSPRTVAAKMIEAEPIYLTPQNYHVVAEVDPKAGAKQVELNLTLDAGPSVFGRVVDPEGKPVTGYYYTGQLSAFADIWTAAAGDRFEVKGYDAASAREAYFAEQSRNLAARAVIKGDSPQDLVVRLQAAGKAAGRLVDQSGDPLPNCRLIPWSPPMGSPADAAVVKRSPPLPHNLVNWQDSRYETDNEGRFAIACLVPGVEYRLRAFDLTSKTPAVGRAPTMQGVLAKVIVVKAGEQLDLGDVRLVPDAVIAKQLAGASAAAKPPTMRLVRGHVIGLDGKPAARVSVALIGANTTLARGGEFPARSRVLDEATTDDAGRFELKTNSASKDGDTRPFVVAQTEGAALVWKNVVLKGDVNDLTLQLRPETAIRGKLVDLEGGPAARVSLRIAVVFMRLANGMLQESNAAGFDGEQTPAAWAPTVVTDDEGRFTLHHLAGNHGAFLKVVGDDRFAPQDVILNSGMPEQRGERDGTYRSLIMNLKPGEEALLTLAPSQVFEGTVRYADTGHPAPFARLTIWASQQREFGSMMSVAGKADAQGHYHIVPNPGVRFGVTAYPPDGAPYLVQRTDEVKWEDGAHLKTVDVTLERGVLIRGRVTEQESGDPIAGAALQYLPRDDNAAKSAGQLFGWQGIQTSDAEGRFELVVLPGAGTLLVHGPQNNYVVVETTSSQIDRGRAGGTRRYAHAIVPLDLHPDEPTQSLEVKLNRGKALGISLVDEQGKSIDDALLISWRNTHASDIGWRGESVPVTGGRTGMAGLAAGEEYTVHFLDAKRRLGATVAVHAGQSEQQVTLKSCGQVNVRCVDAAGKPASHFPLDVELIARPGANKLDNKAMRKGAIAADMDFIQNVDRINYSGPMSTDTENDGRLNLPTLIPGATYRILINRKGEFSTAKEFKVGPGETLELGEIVVEADN